MDSQTLWLIALSISTPIAGVVGFAIQLRKVKKTRLENEKLQLEIEALKKQAAAKDNRIVPASMDDVLKFGNNDIRFSRKNNEVILDEKYKASKRKKYIIYALGISFLIPMIWRELDFFIEVINNNFNSMLQWLLGKF